MLNPNFELLVKLPTGVRYVLAEKPEKLEAWAERYAQKGTPSIVIDRVNQKGKAFGPKVNWCKYTKIVKVTFGDRAYFSYYTSKHWEVGDARQIKTRRGVRWGVVCEAPVYMTLEDVMEKIEDKIHRELDTLEDVIVE